MKYPILKLLSIFIVMGSLPSFAGIGDIDADGWTILEPSEDSRLIYVSSSEGNDANDGLSPQTPKATIDAANVLVRNNQPDWLMLKRGDTFDMPNLGSWKSGRSAEEPLVLTYYGDSGPRPIIKLTGTLINWNGNPQNHVAVVGLDLYRAISDPESPEFTSSSSNLAFRFLPGPMNHAENVLVEDCILRYCWMVIQGYGAEGVFPSNFYIRRNAIMYNWAHFTTDVENASNRVQGMFIEGIQNFYLEENLFHHNGWSELVEGAGANLYNHNVYMGTRIKGDIVARGNIISFGSANGIQLRSGGFANMNAFVGNAIGMNLGYIDLPEYYEGITVANDNVVTDGRPQIPGDITEPQTGAIWGFWKQSIEDLFVNDNVVANIANTEGNPSPYRNMTPQQYGYGNIAWNWFQNDFPAEDPGWLDPTRNGDSYGDHLGVNDWDGFIEAAASRGIREFPYEFSAYAYVNYVREGFNMPPVTPPYIPVCDDVPVTGVEVSDSELSIAIHEVERISASVFPSDACDHSILWSIDDTSVALIDDRGVIYPVAPGTTTITVTTIDGGFEDTCTLTITEVTEPFNVAKGKSATVDSNHGASAGANAAIDGNFQNLNETRWVSANTAWPHWIEVDLQGIFTISRIRHWSGDTNGYSNGFGYIFQYKDGDTWIDIIDRSDNTEAIVDESFDPITVDSGIVRLYGTGGNDNLLRLFELEVYGTVDQFSVTGVSIDQALLSLPVSETAQLNAVLFPANATNKDVTWESSNSSIATVDENGLVTAIEAGSCFITVTTADGGFTDSSEVTVLPAAGSLAAFIGAQSTQNPGEFSSDWLGTFYAPSSLMDWNWHGHLGWLYAGALQDSDNLWLWSQSLDLWIYTNSELFPWLYSDSEIWHYFLIDSEDTGWIYHTESESWTSIEFALD